MEKDQASQRVDVSIDFVSTVEPFTTASPAVANLGKQMLDKGKVLESSLPQYNDVDTVFTPSGVLEPITDVAAVAHSMAQGGFSINIDTDEACKKVTKKQMKKHIKSDHGIEKRFYCAFCSKELSMKNRVKEHIRTLHATTNSFAWGFCDKKFCMKNENSIHEQSHTGREPV